jgi:hypothetical protein
VTLSPDLQVGVTLSPDLNAGVTLSPDLQAGVTLSPDLCVGVTLSPDLQAGVTHLYDDFLPALVWVGGFGEKDGAGGAGEGSLTRAW